MSLSQAHPYSQDGERGRYDRYDCQWQEGINVPHFPLLPVVISPKVWHLPSMPLLRA